MWACRCIEREYERSKLVYVKVFDFTMGVGPWQIQRQTNKVPLYILNKINKL